MTDAEFNHHYALYRDAIEGMARKLARADNDLFDDLVSVGMIRLWELDTSKASTNPGSWIRAAIRNGMVDFLRQQRFNETESLTALLAAGNQVTQDPDTGVAYLVVASPVIQRKELEDIDSFYGDQAVEDDK